VKEAEAEQAEIEAEIQRERQAEEARLAAIEATDREKNNATGVQEKGRRNAFDEGQPWHRAGGAPLAEPQQSRAKQQKRSRRLIRRLEESRDAATAEEREEILLRASAASMRVNERCQRKVQRIHDQFLRQQGQLSTRLQGRVKRLQMDFQEIHDLKVNSILPDTVVQPRETTKTAGDEARSGTAPTVDVGGTVLQYLKRHRHLVERDRRTHHAIYLQQVERFQGHLRLLADPNRTPERGEIYLSECFRHVLAAGLIVDDVYFFRTLRNLEPEDFEKIATVNLLAACCQAFDVDLHQYWAFVRDAELPRFVPRPCPDQVRSWEDWAPWNGVELERVLPASHDEAAAGTDEGLATLPDPLPFGPIVPEEMQGESELASRDDPLADILKEVALDAVLARYNLAGRGDSRGSPRRGDGKDLGGESLQRSSSASSGRSVSETGTAQQTASCSVADVRSLGNAGAAAGSAAALASVYAINLSTDGAAAVGEQQGTPAIPRAPRQGRGAAPRRPLLRGHATLRQTRGLAEPMGEMSGAPDKGRPRAAAQPPSMGAVREAVDAEELG